MTTGLVERRQEGLFNNFASNTTTLHQTQEQQPLLLDDEHTPIRQNDTHWTRRISSTTKILILLLLSMCIAGAIMVACNVQVTYWGGGDQWQWIDYLYFLSFVKVGVSIVKYIPQVILNYQRKSTSGWQIWNIILDFSGGSLNWLPSHLNINCNLYFSSIVFK